jgi:hydroxypyruvate reductase
MRSTAVLETTRALFAAAVAAVDPRTAVARALERDRPRVAGKLWLVAVGKAAPAMAQGALDVLGAPAVHDGVIVTKRGQGHAVGALPVREAGHPTPDASGVAAAAELRALLARVGREDLVLCLISGGGSALLTSPADPVTLDELRATTSLLLGAGAPITELNAVRKHLETLKGGGLAALAAPAPVIALVVSDVPGDRLDAIASGPTVGDSTTFAEAWDAVSRRGVLDQVPAAVRARLAAGRRGELAETPRPDDPIFARVETRVIAGLREAAEGAAQAARARGYEPVIGSLTVEGEARDVAPELIAAARAPGRTPLCFIAGGETTVTVRGRGRGGRNTELALAAALAIDGRDDVAVASLATDGDDGTTGAAGAVATGETVELGRARGLDAADFLARNDSASYFEEVGGLLATGPTGTNVADLFAVLVV